MSDYPLQDWWKTVKEMIDFVHTGQIGNFIFHTVKDVHLLLSPAAFTMYYIVVLKMYISYYYLSPAASTCLTLREIENELSEVTGADWYPLGVQLGLRPPTLREIQKNYPLNTEQCRREMLDLWLCSTPEASWKSLAQAVQALGRYTSLAQKLRTKVPPAPKG